MSIYWQKMAVSIVRVASLEDVRDLEDRTGPLDEHDVVGVRKKLYVVVQGVEPIVKDGRTYRPEQNIATWTTLQADDRVELLTALRAVGIRDMTMRTIGEALPALAKALPAVAAELTLFQRVLDGAIGCPLTLNTETLVAGYSIVCEGPPLPAVDDEAAKDDPAAAMLCEADRARRRGLNALLMHLADYGYSMGDPQRAAFVWSQAVARAGGIYCALATNDVRANDHGTTMGTFVANMAADLALIVAAVERARRTPKARPEIDPAALIRGRNRQLTLNLG